MTAAAPEGYCINMPTSRPQTGFVLMTACAANRTPAVITMQVGAANTALVNGSEPLLAAFLESGDGAQLLSGENDAAKIDVRRAMQSRNRVTVLFDDGNPPPLEGMQAREWRIFTDAGNRLVTLAVRGLSTDPLADSAGLDLLNRAMATFVAANQPATPEDS